MRTEYSHGEYLLGLNRDELVLLISALIDASELNPSDLHFKDRMGWERSDVPAFPSQLADFCRSADEG